MKATTKRSLMILTAVVLLAGSVIVYQLLTAPAHQEIAALRGKVSGLSQSLATYRVFNDQFKNLLSEYQNLTDLKNQISLILPAGTDAPYAIEQAIGLAKMSNLKVQSLNIKPLAIKPPSLPLAKGIGTLRIDLKLSGAYENFKLFLKAVESNILISEVVNFKVEKLSGETDLNFSVTMDSYYQAE